MLNRIASLSTAALLAAAIGSSAALADGPAAPASGAVYGAGSVGALYWETKGLATSSADVARQGGAATAATVRWTSGPAAPTGAAYGFGTVGAMVRETAGLATSSADAARQGGGLTASAVRWTAAAPAQQPGS